MSLSYFPLLRLPSVPLDEVIKCMEPIVVLTLFQFTRKSRMLVKNSSKRLSIHMTISSKSSSTNISFGYKDQNSKVVINYTSKNVPPPENVWKIAKNLLAYVDIQLNSATLYCNLKTAATMRVTDFLMEAFTVESVSVKFEKESESYIDPMLKYIKVKKLKVEKAILAYETGGDNLYKQFLRQFGQISELEIFSWPSGDFKFDKLNEFTLNSLKIDYAHWITSNHLYSLRNCKSIHLNSMRLTDQDLKEFVKKWMVGESKLEYMELRLLYRFDLETVVQELNPVMMDSATMRDGETHQFAPSKCYSIQRNDGVEAIVCDFNETFILKID